jgi:hypothetical protein
MWQDPIVAEIRRVRQAHAAQFGYDLKAIYEALKAQEKQGQRTTVSYPPRRIPPVTATKQAVEI